MPRNLLVVDDSATVQDAVRLSLTGEDWTVTAVASTAEALEALDRDPPEAVLCDVAVGEEDGYDACRALRAAAGGAELPIILMGNKVSETLATSAGATSVLAKPFHSDELAEALGDALEQAGLAAVEDDFLSLEPVLPDAGVGGPGGAAAPGAEQVEIIDLSDDEDLGDLELLDLEPLPAGQGPARAEQEELRPLSAEDLDLLAFEPAPPAPGATAPRAPAAEARASGPEHLGPIEFDLGDFEARAEEEAPGQEPVGALLPELDLEALEAVEPAPAAPAGGQAEDLLADIDLEGWAEEDMEPAPPIEPVTAEASAPTPPPAAAPASLESLDFGLEDLEPLDLGEEEPAAAATALPGFESGEPLDLDGEEAAPAPEEGREARLDDEWLIEPTEALAVEEPGPGAAEPGALPAEPLPASEAWAAEPPAVEPEAAALEAAAEPEPVPLETDETWAAPEPTPAPESPWDRTPPAPEALAQRVAADAGAAVRRALEQSLSPEALTPLVQATVERVVWEVVPQLAERLIREAIERLQEDPPAD